VTTHNVQLTGMWPARWSWVPAEFSLGRVPVYIQCREVTTSIQIRNEETVGTIEGPESCIECVLMGVADAMPRSYERFRGANPELQRLKSPVWSTAVRIERSLGTVSTTKKSRISTIPTSILKSSTHQDHHKPNRNQRQVTKPSMPQPGTQHQTHCQSQTSSPPLSQLQPNTIPTWAQDMYQANTQPNIIETNIKLNTNPS
jgi:hypothetical protein